MCIPYVNMFAYNIERGLKKKFGRLKKLLCIAEF